jgi:hypothetical protein
MTKYQDFPFSEICEAVKEHADNGLRCYQKFTCEQCGQRLTMDVPNVVYQEGTGCASPLYGALGDLFTAGRVKRISRERDALLVIR